MFAGGDIPATPPTVPRHPCPHCTVLYMPISSELQSTCPTSPSITEPFVPADPSEPLRSALLHTSNLLFRSSAPLCSSAHPSHRFSLGGNLSVYHAKRLLAPSPLPRALSDLLIPSPLRPSLFGVQDEAQHIKRKLREFETHVAEGTLGLVAQDVRTLAPEAGDGFPDREVRARGVLVDVTGVCDFSKRGRGDEVDLAVGEGFEGLCAIIRQMTRGIPLEGWRKLTDMPSFSARVYTLACFSN